MFFFVFSFVRLFGFNIWAICLSSRWGKHAIFSVVCFGWSLVNLDRTWSPKDLNTRRLWRNRSISYLLAPVVQKVDNAIHLINHYPVDSAIGFSNTDPLDSDLSSG